MGCDLARADIVRLSFLSLLPISTFQLHLYLYSLLEYDYPTVSSATSRNVDN